MSLIRSLRSILTLALAGTGVTTFYLINVRGVPFDPAIFGGIVVGLIFAMVGAIAFLILPALVGAVKAIFGWDKAEEEEEPLPEPAKTYARWHGYAFGAMAFSMAGVVLAIFGAASGLVTIEVALFIMYVLGVVAVLTGLLAKWLEPPELRDALRRAKERQGK